MCIFKNELQICFQTKKECDLESNKKCKYYLKQIPEDKEIYKTKLKKALKKALEKRDIYNSYKHLAEDNQIIDFNKTIYENIKGILEHIQNYTIIKKELRKLAEKDLEGDILKNITSNLYNQIPIEIIQKFNKTNSVIILENDQKYKCELKVDITDFLDKLKRARKKDVFFEKMIKTKIKIK